MIKLINEIREKVNISDAILMGGRVGALCGIFTGGVIGTACGVLSLPLMGAWAGIEIATQAIGTGLAWLGGGCGIAAGTAAQFIPIKSGLFKKFNKLKTGNIDNELNKFSSEERNEKHIKLIEVTSVTGVITGGITGGLTGAFTGAVVGVTALATVKLGAKVTDRVIDVYNYHNHHK